MMGAVRNPHTGILIPWTPVATIAVNYAFLVSPAARAVGYACLGVIGNEHHLAAEPPGDHTPYSAQWTWANGHDGPVLAPKKGRVYACDAHVPEPARFEAWLLGRLRAGVYADVIKYFNINNRHWNRKSIRAGHMFAYSLYSPDPHLHLSTMPGQETAAVTVLADYEVWRTTGRQVASAASTAGVTPPAPFDHAALALPLVRQNQMGRAVGVLQAALTYRGRAPGNIDGVFGPGTLLALRVFQTMHKLPVTGATDPTTWDTLLPEAPQLVDRGTSGPQVRLLQGLLTAWGYRLRLDGEAGPLTTNAVARFQAAHRVPNSVYRGRGDGVAGTNTWVALLKA